MTGSAKGTPLDVFRIPTPGKGPPHDSCRMWTWRVFVLITPAGSRFPGRGSKAFRVCFMSCVLCVCPSYEP